MKHVDAGLFRLGLWLDSDQSVFHQLSAVLPEGMFDGHRSVLPSPDHLFFLGLTKKLVQGVFSLLHLDLRPTIGVSLREALAHAGFSCTKVYPSNKTPVNSLGISKWAAVCVVGPHACRRAIPDELLTGPVSGVSPLDVAIDLLQDLYDVVLLACYYPQIELDGEASCMARGDANVELRRRVSVLLRGIRAACVRPDCGSLALIVDVSNVHRMNEAVWHAVELLGSLRDSFELLFESMHQPLKRSIRGGNGHNDVHRAMSKMVDNEVVARLALDPAKFGVPSFWLRQTSLSKLFESAVPLASRPAGDGWTAGRQREEEQGISSAAKLLVSGYVTGAVEASWRRHAVRAGVAVRRADAVAVLVNSDSGEDAVHTVDVGEENAVGVHASFFHVVALWVAPNGRLSAVVSPFVVASQGAWTLDTFRVLHLPLGRGVRKALALHDCTSACSALKTGRVSHDATNSWVLYVRERGFPPRQG